MKTIFNFGRVYKDITEIASQLLKHYETIRIPVVGTQVYRSKNLQIVSPCYGAAMIIDAINFGGFTKGDIIVFVGSMGALAKRDDPNKSIIEGMVQGTLFIPEVIVPGPFAGTSVRNNQVVEKALKETLKSNGLPWKEFKHGTSIAVSDTNTNMKNYTSAYYGEDVGSLDLESYHALKLCKDKGIRAAVLLYCIDHPGKKIKITPPKEFFDFEQEMDKKMNKIAFWALEDYL